MYVCTRPKKINKRKPCSNYSYNTERGLTCLVRLLLRSATGAETTKVRIRISLGFGSLGRD